MSSVNPTRHDNDPNPRDLTLGPQGPPTGIPSLMPSAPPSRIPSFSPTTAMPTIFPTMMPSIVPSGLPSSAPTETVLRCKVDMNDQQPIVCGDVAAFDCSTDAMTTYKVDVMFDYDLYVNTAATLENSRAYVEENLLFDLARSLGLDSCPVGARRRRRQLQDTSLDNNYNTTRAIVGLVSTPIDQVDERFGGACTSSYEGDASVTCFPMRGQMEALLTIPTSENPRNMLLGRIETTMSQDQLIVPDFIEKVVFIGNRTQVVNPFVTGDRRSFGIPNISSNGKNATLIGIMVGLGSLLLFLLLLLLLILCLRRHRERSKLKSPDDELDDIDITGRMAPLAHTDSLALKVQLDLNETFDTEKSFYDLQKPDIDSSTEFNPYPDQVINTPSRLSVNPVSSINFSQFRETESPVASSPSQATRDVQQPPTMSFDTHQDIEAVLEDDRNSLDTPYNYCSRIVLHSMKEIQDSSICFR